MTDLDALIERARSATIDRAAAERYVREIEHMARELPGPRRWMPWLASGLAAAAAVGVVLWLWRDAASGVGVPVSLSDRVTIVADPGTTYRVGHAGSDDTWITVDRGAVTARLWPGERAHRLVLHGGDVTAEATGTVYSLAVRPGGAVVSVMQGTVNVRETLVADGVHVVHSGQTWPAGGKAADPAAGRALLELSAPARASMVEDAGLPANAALPVDAWAAPEPADADEPVDVDTEPQIDAGERVADARLAANPPAPKPPLTKPPTIKDRWHTARSLRSQGQLAAAVTECLAIADAGDATWSPIALVEAVRIELGPLADPERAIALADRMIREWPADALASETRELRCRALHQLGRGDECALAPQP